MSESSNSAWPFGEISGEEGLDIEAIFKDSTGADQSNPFASPVEAAASDPAPEAQEPPAEPAEHRISPQRLLQHPRSLKRLRHLHPNPLLPRLRKSLHPSSRR